MSQIRNFIKKSFVEVCSSIKKSLQSAIINFPSPVFGAVQSKSLSSSFIRKIRKALLMATSGLMIFKAASVEALTEEEKYKTVKIFSMDELSLGHPIDTLVFFDIDDTLFDFPHMLGSKAWRKYIVQATMDTGKNWHDVLSLYLVKNMDVIPVEPVINQVVRDLQNKGYIVCGLTARERQMWYSTSVAGVDALTVNQLKAANIYFDNDVVKKGAPGLAQDSEYYDGVFFANTDLKGDYLKNIFDKYPNMQLPRKVVFVDDKLSQIQSVSAILKEMKIEHECYWYCATDEKANKFSPLIANIQFYYLLTMNVVISDLEAEAIAEEYPERDADHYLKLILERFEE